MTEEWNGRQMTYTFEYRDPWLWILSLVKDPVLASLSNWHAFQKFLCSDGKEERWYDHPKSATRCWEIEVSCCFKFKLCLICAGFVATTKPSSPCLSGYTCLVGQGPRDKDCQEASSLSPCILASCRDLQCFWQWRWYSLDSVADCMSISSSMAMI